MFFVFYVCVVFDIWWDSSSRVLKGTFGGTPFNRHRVTLADQSSSWGGKGWRWIGLEVRDSYSQAGKSGPP